MANNKKKNLVRKDSKSKWGKRFIILGIINVVVFAVFLFLYYGDEFLVLNPGSGYGLAGLLVVTITSCFALALIDILMIMIYLDQKFG